MDIIFENVALVIIVASVFVVFSAVVIDFALYGNKENTKKQKRSIVATGSMTAFFIIYFIVIRLGIGKVLEKNYFLITIGTLMIAFGALVNVLGRINLKDNWANHIKIYENHKLLEKGVYKIVRHPLYASIMLMLIGGSIVYRNLISLLLTCAVFIPFMYYRAKQEEELLLKEFPQYAGYQKKVGMFFPRIGRKENV